MLKNQIRSSGIQVFTVSESWLTEAIPDGTIGIEGYNSTIRGDRDGGNSLVPKGGGGLVCYIKEGIKYSETKLRDNNVSCKELEMLWVRLYLDNVRPIVIVNVYYKPPQGSYVKCCELLSEAFERANLKDNTDIFMLGDFNSDKTTPAYKELDFTTKALSLKQLIDIPTRPLVREGVITETILDLLFTNSEFVGESKLLDFILSDHLGILVTRKKTPVKINKVDFMGRSYRNYDRDTFQENLINSDWEEFYRNNDQNWLWDFMYKIILDNIEY